MIVLDQNQLGRHDFIMCDAGPFLLPDIAVFENIKNDGWRDDVRRSLEAFRLCPEKLYVSHSVGQLLSAELATRTITSSPVDEGVTASLRALLPREDFFAQIEANVEDLRAKGLHPIVHVAENRQSLQKGMKALQEIVGEDCMREFRRMCSREEKPAVKEFATSIAALTDRTLPQSLQDLGLNSREAQPLCQRKSAFYRMQFCFWAQVFQYSMGSPQLQKKDDKLINDLVDSDYAIVGSFFERLETSDDKLRDRHEALTSILKETA